MTAPSKPWEAAGVNLRTGVSPLSVQSSSTVPDVSVRTMSTSPPPLPPRPVNVGARRPTSNPGIVGGSTMYRGYPSSGGYASGYGGYGGYGTYGMYGNGYGGYGATYSGYPYGLQQSSDNRLVALAEERTRPAFESIESVVRAFGSVSFMLESTLGALHASFRAALGVADHLSHLRNILSALSIFRLLRWCIHQLRRLFGLRHQEAAFGGVWGEAAKVGAQVASEEASPLPSGPSQWPLRAFIGIVISGSYLAWRLLSYIVGPGGTEGLSPFKGEENEPWVLGRDPGCQLAVACHNFSASLEQELSFAIGDRLIIAPKARQPLDCREWMLAAQYRTVRNPPQTAVPAVQVGLVPSNYVRILERRPRPGVYQMGGGVVPQAPIVPLGAQPHPLSAGLPLATAAPSATMAYGQPVMPASAAAIPLCNPTGMAPNPVLVNPLPVGVPVVQPLGTADPDLADSSSQSSQTLGCDTRGSGSDSKPVDEGLSAQNN